ncbi:MAG: DUF2182 domain-containing protein [archaeon]|nr:MAG: DUF2182 domain-containing protein [archaeon]
MPNEPPIVTADRLSLSVSAILLSVAGASWVATYYLGGTGPTGTGTVGVASMVSSLLPASVALFELIWVVGMVAMMFPAMVPIVVFYNRMVAEDEPDPRLAKTVGTSLFLLGYVGVYAALGALAYLAVYVALWLAGTSAASASLVYLGPSLVLILAGAYQLSPMKLTALTHCVSPLTFFTVHLRRGLSGSLRMGITHGFYCVSCCWTFMLVMLAVGAMSLPYMAALAGVIGLEKVVVRGAAWFERAVAVGFIGAGGLILLLPMLG